MRVASMFLLTWIITLWIVTFTLSVSQRIEQSKIHGEAIENERLTLMLRNVKYVEFEKGEISWEKELLRDIAWSYQQNGFSGRPVRDIHTTVNMKFKVGLIKLELDEKEKRLTISTWTRYIWRDEYLQWNTSEYGGLDKIRLEPSQIWMPDIELYNTGETQTDFRPVKCVVTSDGMVTYYTLAVYRISCALQLANYPFDEQQCSLWFGSWTHNSSELNIFSRGLDLTSFNEDFKETATWDIVENTLEKDYFPARNMTPNFAVIIFKLKLARKVVFSTYLLTLPCIFLAFLTLVVFWLPSHRPDRTTLAMNTFGSFMLLLLILIEAAPPTTSSVPTLGVYYCFNIVIIVLAIMLSTVVVNVSEGLGSSHVPRPIVKMMRGPVGKMLLIGGVPALPSKTISTAEASEETLHSLISVPKNGRQSKTESQSCVNALHRKQKQSRVCQETSCYCASTLEEQVSNLSKELDALKDCLKSNSGSTSLDSNEIIEKNIEKRKKAWRLFGVFLDRIFFVMYVVFIVISLIFLFPRPKGQTQDSESNMS